MDGNRETTGNEALSRDVQAVLRNLASRLAYLRLYQAASHAAFEREVPPLLREFVEEEREIISLLAGQLRQLSQPVPEEVRDDRLVHQFGARRGTLDRLAFVRQGLAMAAEWYEERAGDEGHSPAVRALFTELGATQRRRMARLDALVRRLHGEKE